MQLSRSNNCLSSSFCICMYSWETEIIRFPTATSPAHSWSWLVDVSAGYLERSTVFPDVLIVPVQTLAVHIMLLPTQITCTVFIFSCRQKHSVNTHNTLYFKLHLELRRAYSQKRSWISSISPFGDPYFYILFSRRCTIFLTKVLFYIFFVLCAQFLGQFFRKMLHISVVYWHMHSVCLHKCNAAFLPCLIWFLLDFTESVSLIICICGCKYAFICRLWGHSVELCAIFRWKVSFRVFTSVFRCM